MNSCPMSKQQVTPVSSSIFNLSDSTEICDAKVAKEMREKASSYFWAFSLELLPDGSVDDLVEQVVMQVSGCRKTQKLHSERGDEA